MNAFRFLSSPLRVLPDFMIPGEAKCGTTTLYHALARHPQVLGSDVKEPNNFREFSGSPLFSRMHFPFLWTAMGTRLRRGNAMAGEASAEYFSKPDLPEIIRGVVPDVKLIFLFRDPARRAYSDWQMLFRAEKEDRSFEEVVEESLDLLARGDAERLLAAMDHLEYHPLRFVARGMYVRPLQRWIHSFSRDQMLFLKSEDFFQDPERVLKEVCAFLGLSSPPQALEVERRKRGKYQEPMSEELHRRLNVFYRPWNEQFVEKVGWASSWNDVGS